MVIGYHLLYENNDKKAQDLGEYSVERMPKEYFLIYSIGKSTLL